MCGRCVDFDRELARQWNLPPDERPVPPSSGEGAIYTPEYLAAREGNANGTDPEGWRTLYVH